MLCLAAFAVGRQAQAPSEAEKNAATLRATLKLAELQAVNVSLGGKPEQDATKATDEAASLLEKVAANLKAAMLFANGTLMEYYDDHASAKSAPQATQVATETSVRLQYMQVAQNARIVALLERLTATKN